MKKVITIFLVLLPFLSHAQLQGQSLIDSLKKELALAQEDTNKVNLLWKITYEYYINSDSGIKYGEEELKLAKILASDLEIAKAHLNLGEHFQFKAQYHDALDHYFKSEKIFERIGKKERKWQGKTLEATGNTYMLMESYPKALGYYLSALKIREAEHDTEGIAGNLSNIGNIYTLQKDYVQALDYYSKAQKIFVSLKNQPGIANCLTNIGYAFQGQRIFDKAIDNYFKALAIYEEMNRQQGIATTLGNIGEAYFFMASDTTNGSGHILNNKAPYLDKAIFYLNKAIASSKANDQLDNIIEFSKYLSNAYELNNNYKEALENYKQYATIHDSVFNSSSNEKIAKLEQDGLKERNKAALAQKQTEQKLYITGITFLIVVIAYVGRKFLKQLRSNKILSKEAKKALARIEAQSNVLVKISYTQAHEVRGPITTILGLVSIFNHDDPADPLNKQLLDDINEVTLRLDKTVQGIIKQENNLSHETDME